MKEKNKRIHVKVPARFHIDIMNTLKLKEGKIGGGGIGIAIESNFEIYIEAIDNKTDIIEAIKPNLIKFYIDLLRKKLKINTKFYVKCKINKEIKTHGGMGSNAIIQVGIIYAINNLMGNILSDKELLNFLQENYVEEENGIITKNVFCSGVAHNTIMYGGICIVSENGKLIYNKEMPENIRVGLIRAEMDEIFGTENNDKDKIVVKLRKERYKQLGIKNKEEIIRNTVIKDLKNNDYKSFVDAMKKNSKNDDSSAMTEKCKIRDFRYNEFCKLVENIGNTFVRISSNSSNIYVITDSFLEIREICNKYNIEINEYKVNNEGIKIIL